VRAMAIPQQVRIGPPWPPHASINQKAGQQRVAFLWVCFGCTVAVLLKGRWEGPRTTSPHLPQNGARTHLYDRGGGGGPRAPAVVLAMSTRAGGAGGGARAAAARGGG